MHKDNWDRKILVIKPAFVSVFDTENTLSRIVDTCPSGKITLLAVVESETDYQKMVENQIADKNIIYNIRKRRPSAFELLKLIFTMRRNKYNEVLLIKEEKSPLSRHEKYLTFSNVVGGNEVYLYYPQAEEKVPLSVRDAYLRRGGRKIGSVINGLRIKRISVPYSVRYSFRHLISLILLIMTVIFFLIYIVGSIKIKKLYWKIKSNQYGFPHDIKS